MQCIVTVPLTVGGSTNGYLTLVSLENMRMHGKCTHTCVPRGISHHYLDLMSLANMDWQASGTGKAAERGAGVEQHIR